jgi:cyclopropane fatty-acyl-phospholipid synthase-like methyltransferase
MQESPLSNPSKPGTNDESLGLGLHPGDRHYRAYVGPPEDYDLIAAMTFNLLTTLGLRQGHRILDVGCGSLRLGRLLIPYLNTGNYTGIEPNQWLVDEGIRRETGLDQIRIKQPRFHFDSSVKALRSDELFDFAVAQSIFSHCGPDLVERWLSDISTHLKDTGALAATFLIGDHDCQDTGWIYPSCVQYSMETMTALSHKAGLKFLLLDWKHPRQRWALYRKPGFDATWFQDQHLTWNTWLAMETSPNRAGKT